MTTPTMIAVRGCINAVTSNKCGHSGETAPYSFGDADENTYKVYLCSFHMDRLRKLLKDSDPEDKYSAASIITDAEFIDQTMVKTLQQWDDERVENQARTDRAVKRFEERGQQLTLPNQEDAIESISKLTAPPAEKQYRLGCNSCKKTAWGNRAKLEELKERGGLCKPCKRKAEATPTTDAPVKEKSEAIADEPTVKPTCQFWTGKGKCGVTVPMAKSKAVKLAKSRTPVLCDEHIEVGS